MYVRDWRPYWAESERIIARLEYAAQVQYSSGFLCSAILFLSAGLFCCYTTRDLDGLTGWSLLKYVSAAVLAGGLGWWLAASFHAAVEQLLRDYVARTIVNAGLLLDVMSEDAFERFPRLRLEHAQWDLPMSTYRLRKDSFELRMMALADSYMYLCRMKQRQAWPSQWRQSVVWVGVLATACMLTLAVAVAMFQSPHFANIPLEASVFGNPWTWRAIGLLLMPCLAAVVVGQAEQQAAARGGLADALFGQFADGAQASDDEDGDEGAEIEVYRAAPEDEAAWDKRAQQHIDSDAAGDDDGHADSGDDTGWS